MSLYRNVSGQDRILMMGAATGVKVLDGDTVEVTDPALVRGLVGQESVWQPVTEPEPDDEEE